MPSNRSRLGELFTFRKKKEPAVSVSPQPTPPSNTPAASPTPVQRDSERRSEILASITTILNLAEKCLDGCPIWGAKAAVSAVSSSIETVQTQLENEEGIDDVVELVQKTVEMLKPSTATLPTYVSPALQSQISNHVLELERIRASTSKWTKAEKNLPRRLLDARRVATELEGVMKEIQQANLLFIMETTMKTEMKVENIQQNMVDAKDQSLLALLRPVTEAFHNASNAPTPCLEGTREQLISDIFDWFNNADPSCEHVFWLSGLAGTGKSSVARTIADRAQDQGRLAATYFFSRNTAATRAPSAIIPTIVYQLALSLLSFRPIICADIASDRDVRGREVAVQAKKLLDNVSREAVSDGPFLVVLDALDECYFENGRQGGNAIPMLLEKFRPLGHIKFLITSRVEAPIQRMFDNIRSQVALHDIEKDIVQRDIHHYLDHSFTELARDWKIAPPFPPASELNELVRRAGSLFVYAATVTKWISQPEAQPLLRLREILDKDEDEVPYQHKFLDDMYSEILSQAVKTSSNPRKHECALKNVISTVVLLQEPVPASALAILAGERTRTAALLPLLSAVLLVDEPAPVRLFHPSFPEFILSEERCRDKRFLVRASEDHPSEGHLHLAVQCLEVMNMHLREDICDIKDPSLPNTEVRHLQQTLERVAPAELRYACKHWHVHLRLANTASSSLVGSLETFCTTHLLHWLELLSLLSELPAAQAGIRLLLAYLRSCPERLHTSLVILLTDTERLLSEYREPLDSHALHVYHSAVVTMPMCSLLEGHVSKGVGIPSLRTPRSQGWILQHLKIQGHADAVGSVAFSPDGQSIISGSYDNTVRVWDATTGTEQHTMHGHEDWVRSVAFSPNSQSIVSGSDDCTVRVWDATTGTERHIMHGHEGWVFSVAFSPDGQLIVSGSDDCTVRVWDASTGAEQHTMHGHEGWVRSVAFSPNGQSIASGSKDKTVRVWDATTGTERHIMHGHEHRVYSVAFSPDGHFIVSGSHDYMVRVWDVTTGTERHIMRGHEGWVRSVAFSPDGQSIVSRSWLGTVHVWDASTGTERHTSPDLDSTLTEASHATLAFQANERTGWVWRVPPSGGRQQLCWLPTQYRGRQLAHHGQTACIGGDNGAVTILDFSDVPFSYE